MSTTVPGPLQAPCKYQRSSLPLQRAFALFHQWFLLKYFNKHAYCQNQPVQKTNKHEDPVSAWAPQPHAPVSLTACPSRRAWSPETNPDILSSVYINQATLRELPCTPLFSPLVTRLVRPSEHICTDTAVYTRKHVCVDRSRWEAWWGVRGSLLQTTPERIVRRCTHVAWGRCHSRCVYWLRGHVGERVRTCL